MHRSAVVSPYWIWSWFYFSSPQNVEVTGTGVGWGQVVDCNISIDCWQSLSG